MTVFSAAMAKGKGMSHGQTEPRPGTKIRALYDLLKAHPGEVLHRPFNTPKDNNRLNFLRDSYGFDIRKVGYQRWVLAGEWIDHGRTYIDHFAR